MSSERSPANSWLLIPAGVRTSVWGLLSALLLVLAAPPHDGWPLALVALVPLLVILRTASPGSAMAQGWWCGFATNLAGFWWLFPLLERFGHFSGWTRVLLLMGLCAYQGSVFALWAGASAFLAKRAHLPWLVSAPLAVAVAESLVPFLFPWNLAVTLWRAWPLIQVAELGGPPAVSALLVLFNLVVVELWVAWRQARPIPQRAWFGMGVWLGLIALGLLRAAHIATAREEAPHVRVGIVQPNSGVIDVEARTRNGEKYLTPLRDSTRELARRGASLVVWPESAFPYLFDRQLDRAYAPGHPWELSPGFQGTLLFGALSHSFGGALVHNSAVLVSPSGKVAGLSDKRQLFPLGEFIPFENRFPEWAAQMRERLPESPKIEPGTEPRLLVSGPLRIGALICYEDILPDSLRSLTRLNPNLLVTLSNHAWFGDGAVPEQALALATLNSVQVRRDLVRATSTGVSSLGDALGRVEARSALVAETDAPAWVIGDVALLEVFAVGPHLATGFPYACALTLLLVGICQHRSMRGSGAKGGGKKRRRALPLREERPSDE